MPDPLEEPEVDEEDAADPSDAHLLSTEKSAQLIAWLNSKTKNVACPVCATEKWLVGGHLIQGQIHALDGSLHLGSSTSYPLAFVVCDNCYYVRTFMAAPIGLVPSRAETDG